MIKREAKFQTNILNHFIRRHFKKTIVWETKVTTTTTFYFSKLEKQQIPWLTAVKHGGALYKFSDESRGFKPFDGTFWYKEPAYLVVKYPSGHFYFIDVDDFLHERDTRKKKSMTEERAKEIATLASSDF